LALRCASSIYTGRTRERAPGTPPECTAPPSLRISN